MEKNYKTIPFDVNRINEEGVRVVTRNGLSVRVICVDKKTDSEVSFNPIVALISYKSGEGTPYESVQSYSLKGTILDNINSDKDLLLQVPVKTRRMTNQELVWWLRDCSEEHREWKCTSTVYVNYYISYIEKDANKECEKDILIRRNGGKWEEPLIEIE
jgi:hypothetical protein